MAVWKGRMTLVCLGAVGGGSTGERSTGSNGNCAEPGCRHGHMSTESEGTKPEVEEDSADVEVAAGRCSKGAGVGTQPPVFNSFTRLFLLQSKGAPRSVEMAGSNVHSIDRGSAKRTLGAWEAPTSLTALSLPGPSSPWWELEGDKMDG
jgi:hypothetical protein